MNDYQVVAIIPAAGSGQRMNAGINKIWLTINGEPVLSYVLKIFCEFDSISHIVLVANHSEMNDLAGYIERNWKNCKNRVSIVEGGQARYQSVANGLNFFKDWPGWISDNRMVVIHDAARALLTKDILCNSIEATKIHRAVGVGMPVKDTIKQVDSDRLVLSTPDRSSLWTVQTPQVFDYRLITACYEAVNGINQQFTDDCSVAEYCGYQVKLIPGSYENIKITTPEDMLLAEEIVRRRALADRPRI